MPCQVITGRNFLNIDVSNLAPGSARTLCYKDSSGEELRFLLARGEDGRIRTAFDACRQCYMYHRGYRISGNKVICKECGTTYSIDHMNKGKASCRPIPLKHKMDGKNVEISVASLEKGRKFF